MFVSIIKSIGLYLLIYFGALLTIGSTLFFSFIFLIIGSIGDPKMLEGTVRLIFILFGIGALGSAGLLLSAYWWDETRFTKIALIPSFIFGLFVLASVAPMLLLAVNQDFAVKTFLVLAQSLEPTSAARCFSCLLF